MADSFIVFGVTPEDTAAFSRLLQDAGNSSTMTFKEIRARVSEMSLVNQDGEPCGFELKFHDGGLPPDEMTIGEFRRKTSM